MPIPALNRRAWLAGALAASAAPRAFSQTARAAPDPLAPAFGEVLAQSDFGRLERIAPGVYAFVSTPFDHDGALGALATLSNIGLIETKAGFVAFDAGFRPQGARWIADHARAMTDKPIAAVIASHVHGDHVGGIAGFVNSGEDVSVYMTETTRQLVFERYGAGRVPEGEAFARPPLQIIAPTHILPEDAGDTALEFGGPTLTLEPRAGHTPSDVALRLEDEGIVFAGDLVWQGVFPNYADATPSVKRRHAGAILADPERVVVTGHGGVAKAKALTGYLDMLDTVEAQARAGFEAGKTPEEAYADFALPESLGPWRLFSPQFAAPAMTAWYKEFEAA
ncbi:MAG: MBL fold metallo-hydrolase [Maricaulaceae bacterium]